MTGGERTEWDDLVRRVREGDAAAEDRLVGLIYEDLRRIAARRMRREPSDHTWQATDLVNETLLRLRGDGSLAKAEDATFLLRAAGRAMGQLLIDHHRRRSSKKRGGGGRRHPLDVAIDHLAEVDGVALADLRDEIDRLSIVDARAGTVVHLRFFLGMSAQEVAQALGISQKSVDRDLNFARGWLRDRLKPAEDR